MHTARERERSLLKYSGNKITDVHFTTMMKYRKMVSNKAPFVSIYNVFCKTFQHFLVFGCAWKTWSTVKRPLVFRKTGHIF
jgi:hypothetical protein